MTTAKHSSKTAEHGTPAHIIEHARNLMGGIDLDPASSAMWNRRVKAHRYYTAKDDGLVWPWKGRVFLNPPGDKSGLLVRAFWKRLLEHYLSGSIDQAMWVGFSLEQFVTLQDLRMDPTLSYLRLPIPLDYPTLIPRRRLHYRKKIGPNTSKRSANPPHASYLTWLPPRGVGGDGYSILFNECGYLGRVIGYRLPTAERIKE